MPHSDHILPRSPHRSSSAPRTPHRGRSSQRRTSQRGSYRSLPVRSHSVPLPGAPPVPPYRRWSPLSRHVFWRFPFSHGSIHRSCPRASPCHHCPSHGAVHMNLSRKFFLLSLFFPTKFTLTFKYFDFQSISHCFHLSIQFINNSVTFLRPSFNDSACYFTHEMET